MKIRLLTTLSGPAFTLDPGEHEVENSEAVRLIEAGIAVPVATREMETTNGLPAEEKRTRSRGK